MKESEFKEMVKKDIKEIENQYKACKGKMELPEEELELKKFLEDIWSLRFDNTKGEEFFEKAVVHIMCMDKDNPLNVYTRWFRLSKMNPKRKETTPLWHLLYELGAGEYHCFFIPNIFVFTKWAKGNSGKNIKASNVYFVDIDKIESEGMKPLYNYSREEILEFLFKKYEFLKEYSPSYIVRSGIKGLHLYFTLEYTEELHSFDKKAEHEGISRKLVKVLEADRACVNLNRFLRLPYSTNYKYNISTEMFSFPSKEKTYTRQGLEEGMGKYLLEEMEEVKSKVFERKKITEEEKYEKQKRRIEYIKKAYEKKKEECTEDSETKKFLKQQFLLYQEARKRDLEFWFEKHKKEMEGKRHLFFLLYEGTLKHLNWSEEYRFNRCIKLNYEMSEPLEEKEIRRVVRAKKKYTVSDETCAKNLEFTKEEMTEMECRYSEEEKKAHRNERYKKRNQKRSEERRKKREEKEERIFRIIEENKEASLRELGEKLGMAATSALNWKRKYKEKKEGPKED